MRPKSKVYKAMLPVTLKGHGCILCPALKYRFADEQRYCIITGEVLENYKTQRGQECQLENVEEIEL